jgi:hypothetical protein
VKGGVLLAALAATCSIALAACGAARQDAGEPKRTYAMRVVKASFPAKQSIARLTNFELQIENASRRTAPNVAVSLQSFYYTEKFPNLAADKRPIWVVESGPGPTPRSFVESQTVSPPGGGQTNYVSTWALGPLAPGHIQRFVWRVAPVKAGTYTVHYTVAAGLAGRARAQLKGGGAVKGKLTASIAPVPPAHHVDPATGRVVAGAAPTIP